MAFLDDICCGNQHGWDLCMWLSRKSCGPMHRFRFIVERPRSGTVRAPDLQCVTHWKESPRISMNAQWSGVVLPCPLICKASRCWARLLGHDGFVAQYLDNVTAEQACFPSRIPHVNDLQVSWLLLLHCPWARANYLLQCDQTKSGGTPCNMI